MTKTLARPNSNGFILEQQMTSVYVKDGNGKYGQNSTRLKRSLEVTLILQPFPNVVNSTKTLTMPLTTRKYK